MRAYALMLLLSSGCSLYYGSSPPFGDDAPPPDAFTVPPDGFIVPPDADQPPASGAAMARCEDGQLYVTTSAVFPDQPGHGAGRLIGSCPGACRSAAVACTTADCKDATQALCGAPVSVGATCPLQGTSCQGAESIGCPESTACSNAVPGSTCTCANGRYQCRQATPASATQAAIVGKWRGVVTPPGFAAPYPITLWIYPDGTYWPDCQNAHCSAFYYGGDGPAPDRKITILSTSDTVGSWADIAIDFGLTTPDKGSLSALVVDATTLRFTFSASWLGCGQPFDVNLTRY
jgi:hypothetical protein